jgi:hypothetical protein
MSLGLCKADPVWSFSVVVHPSLRGEDMRPALVLILCASVAACSGGNSPTTPSVQTPTPTPTPAPPVIQAANLQVAGSGTYSCVTGFCTALTWAVTNAGPGCATNTQIVFRAFGSDGAPGAVQLGVDIPMGLPGGSLATYVWRPGVTVSLVSLGGFNDVRSAHTVFRGFETHTNIGC